MVTVAWMVHVPCHARDSPVNMLALQHVLAPCHAHSHDSWGGLPQNPAWRTTHNYFYVSHNADAVHAGIRRAWLVEGS